jgi:DNA repair protein RadD
VRYCIGVMPSGDVCGFEFSFETKLKQGASTDELIKGDMPVVDVFKVDHITYSQHTKVGAPPMVKVTYYCKLNAFSEYVCVEHQNFAQRKAREWWRKRSADPLPETTEEALELVGQLAPATHLRVWINKKYPEIMAVCFDGTAFGTQDATDELPEVETNKPYKSGGYSPAFDPDLDDDIPF